MSINDISRRCLEENPTDLADAFRRAKRMLEAAQSDELAVEMALDEAGAPEAANLVHRVESLAAVQSENVRLREVNAELLGQLEGAIRIKSLWLPSMDYPDNEAAGLMAMYDGFLAAIAKAKDKTA